MRSGQSAVVVSELMSPAGLLLRRDAIAAGYDDNYLARLVRGHQIDRIRQGAYARHETWSSLDARGRHSLLSDAVVTQYDDDIALSHASAVIRHEGPDHGLDLSTVHVTHLLTKSGRRNVAGIVHHEGTIRVLDVTRLDNHWLTSPARTVLDVAMLYGVEVGIVVADDFLHRKLVTKPELRQLSETVKDWPGALILRLVIERCDGRSESVGESLGREFFRKHRLPMPELQYEVYHPQGQLAGRTDWAWPRYGVLGEFDGMQKYLRLRRKGETIAQTVMREKRREDLLRELTGFTFIRFIWADWFRAERTAARVRSTLTRPSGRPTAPLDLVLPRKDFSGEAPDSPGTR